MIYLRNRRAERQKRKHEFKSVNTNSFLIVTEGEKQSHFILKACKRKLTKK